MAFQNQQGTSRLQLMQARFQQRQQEEKEHKLFAMLEEQHDVGSAGMHNSASSNSSSLASYTSSLGSTGSGMVIPGGKVRQMFEERRNLIGRPPIYTKNNSRLVMPTKGWDRSQRLEPLSINVQQTRVRGVSLERKKPLLTDGENLRRSKSQYQVDDEASAFRNPNRVLPLNSHTSNSLKPSFVDGNQNKVVTSNSKQLNLPKRTSRFGHNQSLLRSNPTSNSLRPQVTSPYREDDDNENGITDITSSVYRVKPPTDKYQNSAELSKERELLELKKIIKNQQLELIRLQQAAAESEQRAIKAATTATTTRPSRAIKAVLNSPDERKQLKPAKSNALQELTDDKAEYDKGRIEQFNGFKRDMNAVPEIKPSLNKQTPIQKPVPFKPESVPIKPQSQSRKSIFATAPSSATSGKDGLVSCSLCNRFFASDRVETHEKICAKTKNKKRKVFDITKMRVQGTEAENFVLAPSTNRNHQQQQGKKKPISLGQHIQQQMATTTNSTETQQNTDKKADWRKKHESFIETIRAAKKLQQHLAAGGKASDLPPPPPSDTSDYITCPYCSRRFSPGAADRHIPKCANIKSNKTK